MSQAKLSKSLLPYAIGFCALALLTSCGSRSGKSAGAPAASASPQPQATARTADERKFPGSESLNGGNENDINGDVQVVDSRDANTRMDRESVEMRAANEREKQRAFRMWNNSAKKDREILDAFVDRVGKDKSSRKLRGRIYELAKKVSEGKHDVSKSSHRDRAAKIHNELHTIFKESLNKSVGGVKECRDLTSSRQSSHISADRDLVLACTVSQGVVYELTYKAFSEFQFGQPAAGLELAHVEVSPSEERFRGQRAELEVVMVSSQAHIFKGEKKEQSAICRKMLSYVRSVLRACDNGGSGPGVSSNPCNGDGTDGNGGPCLTDVPVHGEVIVCDENGCVDKRVNSTTRYRFDRSAPRATTPTTVPAPRATVPTTTTPAPVVTNCGPRLNPDGTKAPVVPGMEECDEQTTTLPGNGPSTPTTTAPGNVPTSPGTQSGGDVSDVNDDGETN